MTYAQYGLIQASDYNTLVGPNPSTTANQLNTVWATGGTNAGYGQPTVGQVSVGQLVSASNWASLINTTGSTALHQSSSITSITAPAAGDKITYLSALPTNLQTIYNNRLNCVSQGSTISNTATAPSWSQFALFTHTITFANGDAARYFFNAGGQLKITCVGPGGTGINSVITTLASQVGTVVLSSPTSGAATISGVSYNGITKIGGGGNSPTLLPNVGYYGLTTSNQQVFYQKTQSSSSYYLNTNITVNIRTNGTQGSNGDRGSVITITTKWDEVPGTKPVAANCRTTVTIVPPETTNITNTWGSIGITSTTAGTN
jgi:hypothetical protein